MAENGMRHDNDNGEGFFKACFNAICAILFIIAACYILTEWIL